MASLDEALKEAENADLGFKESMIEQLELVRSTNPEISASVGDGFIVYSLGDSNLVMTTIHDGTFLPDGYAVKQSPEMRATEEDLFTFEFYLPLFLKSGGKFMTSHVSRYFADLNRDPGDGYLGYPNDVMASNLVPGWDRKSHIDRAAELYNEFRATAKKLYGKDTFLFSGHSMKPGEIDKDLMREDFCIIFKTDEEGKELQNYMRSHGLHSVLINKPYAYQRGSFRVWSDRFVGKSLEFEINKRIYLDGFEKHPKNFYHNSELVCDVLFNFYKDIIEKQPVLTNGRI